MEDTTSAGLSDDCPMTVERRVELVALLAQMERARERIYWFMFAESFGSTCHAFIEHCGLMGEFINVCRRNLEKGVDFVWANVHTGRPLELQPFQVAYLREKLECIYGEGICERLSQSGQKEDR